MPADCVDLSFGATSWPTTPCNISEMMEMESFEVTVKMLKLFQA
jgi:hypothetical protein